MTADNTKKFNGISDVYAQARPNYSDRLFDYLKENFNINRDSVFADIGSGTGKFSEQLLQRGYKVFSVEPNNDMRDKAEKLLSKYDNFKSVNGTDANTNLQSNSVEYVIVAQAFHWFDKDLFKNECKRILKPNGKVIIVYNSRDGKSEFVAENAEICKKFCPGFKGFSGGAKQEDIEKFFNNGCTMVKFENNLTYDKDSFIKRMLSASYSLRDGDKNYNDYILELTNLFYKYSFDGKKVIMPNYTIAYIGNI